MKNNVDDLMLQRPFAIETSSKVFLKTSNIHAKLERIQDRNFISSLSLILCPGTSIITLKQKPCIVTYLHNYFQPVASGYFFALSYFFLPRVSYDFFK